MILSIISRIHDIYNNNINFVVRKIIFFIISLLFLVSETAAQRNGSNSSFISVYIGDLSILSENFTDFYDSKNDLTFGIGFGIPISRSFTLDASISYYKKKTDFTIPLELNSNFNSELQQFIYNAGIQFHLLPNRIIGLSFLFGFNYATINEERRDENEDLIYDLNSNGNLGIYGGANFEINFGKSPVALHGDVKYTYAWDTILEYADTYREIRYTGGIKLYLANRWR